jgi:hypothetical protein
VGETAMEFLVRFEEFLLRERLGPEETFGLLLKCIPIKSLVAISAAESVLDGKQWDEVRDQVLRLLEPEKNAAHYLAEFMAVTPRPGETFEEYCRRYRCYLPIVLSIGTSLREFQFLNSLPAHVQQWIRTATATTSKEPATLSLEELMNLLSSKYSGPLPH